MDQDQRSSVQIWYQLQGHVQWPRGLHIRYWTDNLIQVHQDGEVTGSVHWSDLQRWLPDIHHGRDTGDLARPRDANHYHGYGRQLYQDSHKKLSTSERRTSMRPSVKNWVRKIRKKPTCTISTILLWVIPTRNYRRRRHWMPPFRRSRQTKKLSDILLFSGSSAYLININNTPSSLSAWWPDDYTKYSSIQTRTQQITWSGPEKHRGSMRREMGSKIIYPSHVNDFERILYDDKKEADTEGEKILCSILYLKNSDKCSFSKKRSVSRTTKFWKNNNIWGLLLRYIS